MANHQRSVEKEAYWRRHVDRQVTDELWVRAYCREHGLSEQSFYVWRRKLGKRDQQRAAVGKTAHSDSRRSPSPELVQVAVVGSAALTPEPRLEIEVPGGVTIWLREEISADVLQRVLVAVCGLGHESVGHRRVPSC